MSNNPVVTVLGAGSWGTALAIQFARTGTQVRLWARDPEQMAAMAASGENQQYLPGAEFPATLSVEADWDTALSGAEVVLVSVPSHAFRRVLERLAGRDVSLCWATKGLELSTGLLPHQVVNEVLPSCQQFAVLSGPTFATEVGRALPTAITIAASNADYAEQLATAVGSEHFRAYTSEDIIGVEVGGAVKNALAIAAGLSDGLGFGANARVALINRGLREMQRFGVAMGASADTFMGLAGMGDLVLTCTDNQSRNRRMGLALAAGKTVAEAEKDIQQVVEGVHAARAVYEQAKRMGVDMPIVEQVYRVLFDALPPVEAVKSLMARATGSEH